jgi:hypothetical protein
MVCLHVIRKWCINAMLEFCQFNFIFFVIYCMILGWCVYKILRTKIWCNIHIGIVNFMCNVISIAISKRKLQNVYWDFGVKHAIPTFNLTICSKWKVDVTIPTLRQQNIVRIYGGSCNIHIKKEIAIGF